MSKATGAYRVYLFLSSVSSALFAAAFPMTLYETTTAGLDPLQLVLVGTALELSVLLLEVPTGVVADVVSRRLSIIVGHATTGTLALQRASGPGHRPHLPRQPARPHPAVA